MDWDSIVSLTGFLSLLFGYLLGSIPFGVLITKVAGTEDLRSIGSGNIGATNVLRTGRKELAVLTVLGDGLKGTVAVLLSLALLGLAIPAALGAFLGHLFPVWLGFKGGKGIATYAGLLLAFSWTALLTFALVWLGVAFATRYSSLAALCASVSSTLALYLSGLTNVATLFTIITALAWFMHRANISRLLAGTESKIGDKG